MVTYGRKKEKNWWSVSEENVERMEVQGVKNDLSFLAWIFEQMMVSFTELENTRETQV